ncbi:hypothetical protein [Nodosilinea nodulosa]|uniref:hypothetical protein n=1 Tax=Nodosilinea nodulosa TaxID=416001 RepID=UPI0012D84434|nr:hypothetical protein [Nodosilinea nodulosa]
MFQTTLFSALVKSLLSQGGNSDRHPLSYVLAGAAAAAALGAVAPAQAQTAPAQTATESTAIETAAAVPSASGRYLFGQVPQPDQIGQGYVVLERNGDRVYGALYYPSSSFDCFYGQVQGTDLAMTVIDSYEQEAYPYSLALADAPPVATSETTGDLAPFGLSGFFAIQNLSANDHRMLNVCRAAVAPGQ